MNTDSKAFDDHASGAADRRRRLLEELLQRKNAAANAIAPSSQTRFPLSFNQESQWLLNRLLPESSIYNVYSGWNLTGPLDADLLQRSLSLVLERQCALRVSIVAENGVPWQTIETPSLPFTVVELAGLTAAEKAAETARIAREFIRQPFHLDKPPMLRGLLIRQDTLQHMLVIVFHHSASDGWSRNVLKRDVSAVYNALLRGDEPSLPALPVRYVDFAVWQRQQLAGPRLDKLLGYWRKRLDGLSTLALPTTRQRPARMDYTGGVIHHLLPDQLVAKLKALALQEQGTLYMVLLSAFQVMLMRYSNQNDIAVGSAIAGRNRPELENLVGFFVNTLVMRGDLSGNPRFIDLLARIRETVLQAYAHQDMPFEKLVEALNPRREDGRNPLIQILFTLQNFPPLELELDGMRAELVNLHDQTTRVDWSVVMYPTEAGLDCRVIYATCLFDYEHVQQMLDHWTTLLHAVVEAPDTPILQLPMLDTRELKLMLADWNDTRKDWQANTCLHLLLDKRAQQSHDAPAIITEEGQLSYRQLHGKANQLAHYLQSLGVGPDILVGICMDRSADMLVALLATLKAGGAYVPLDPSYPLERLRFMLDDARPAVVLTQSHLRDALPACPAAVNVDTDHRRWSALPDNVPENRTAPHHLAYVIYTSGSTGRPKGVMIPHSAIVNHMLWMEETFNFQPEDAVLARTSISFDASVWEIFAPLLCGGRLVLAQGEALLDPHRMIDIVLTERVTVIQSVPSLLRLFIAEPRFGECNSLRQVFCGGESLDVDLVRDFREVSSAALINLYGPTEATIDATYFPCEEISGAPISIGRPIANARCHVLDTHLNPAPIGVIGELYIGGTGLARGYLHNPELTQQKFIACPFIPGERLYRTGDLASYRRNGLIDFHGRADQQVKLRGFRIETGEIETMLGRLHGIKEVLVTIWEKSLTDRYLVAYFTSAHPLSEQQIKTHLRALLPEYMVPAFCVPLDTMPLMPNGKINRQALPAPAPRNESDTGHKAETEIESALALIWQDALGLESIGIQDDFFELGGHSLLLIQVAARIRDILDVEIPVTELFRSPTIQTLAAVILQSDFVNTEPLTRVVDRQNIPASFSQERLWFLNSWQRRDSYNIHWHCRLSGDLRPDLLRHSLDLMLARHASLRTGFVQRQGLLWQEIMPPQSCPFEFMDTDEQGLESELHKLAGHRFNLDNPPLLHATLFRIGERQFVLSLTFHHIIIDGLSMPIFIRELSACYQALAEGDTAVLPTLPLQFADFAAWERRNLQGERIEKLLAYWRQELEELPPLTLTTSFPRPYEMDLQGDVLTFTLPAALTASLKSLARTHSCTPFMLLFSAFQVLLMRYTGQTDFGIGTPVAGRNHPGLDSIIGFFVNTLVLRARINGNPTFTEHLRQTRNRALKAFTHQDIPFGKLVEALNPPRDMSRNPMFQVMFAYQNESAPVPTFGDVVCEQLRRHDGTSKFDLSLSMTEAGDTLRGSFEFATSLFAHQHIRQMRDHWLHLLAALSTDPGQTVWQLPLFDQDERVRLLNDPLASTANFPLEERVDQLIARQARLYPQRSAILFDDSVISFGELEAQANQLAHYLKSLGVTDGKAVGLCMDRSPELVIAMLAVLKAGGACLPLDPRYPADRLRFMLEDAKPVVVLHANDRADVAVTEDQRSGLRWDTSLWAGQPTTPPAPNTRPEQLAWLIYTSGTTGKPKGVMIPHRAIINHFSWMGNTFAFSANDSVLAKTSISFDVSLWELLAPLISGAKLVLAPPGDEIDNQALIRTIVQQRITFLQMVPSHLNLFLREPAVTTCSSLKFVFCGGEAMPDDLPARFAKVLPDTRLINAYGPTETTIDATWYDCGSHAGQEIPIGQPITNSRCIVMDPYGNPVPPGVPGELFIGGRGLALGYLNQPDLSREKFVQDPGRPGEKLYRTGDCVSRRADGQLLFHGRLDRQIKLRGYRIELGEIENLLLRHPGIIAAVAVLREVSATDRQLVAYFVSDDPALQHDALAGFLAQSLPNYMVPSAWVSLDALPLSPNGKVDPRALPAPPSPNTKRTTTAPRTEQERAVAAIWQEVLGLAEMGVHDDFFAMGGHSLLAMELIHHLQERLGLAVPVKLLFEQPTVAGLLAQLDKTPQLDRDARLMLETIRAEGKRPPLFYIGSTNNARQLAPVLHKDQPVYGLNIFGTREATNPELPVEIAAIAAQFLAEMRKVQPHGPYQIAAYCADAYIAFEISKLLLSAGEQLALFAIVDAIWAPDKTANFSASRMLENAKRLSPGMLARKAGHKFRSKATDVYTDYLNPVTRRERLRRQQSTVVAKHELFYRKFAEANRRYRPTSKYPGRIVSLRSRESCLKYPVSGLEYYLQNPHDLVEYQMATLHDHMFRHPWVEEMAACLTPHLLQAQPDEDSSMQ